MRLDEDALVAAAELAGRTGAQGFEIGSDAVTATVQHADLLVQFSQAVKVWLLMVAASAQHLCLLNDVEFNFFSVGTKVWPHVPEKADDAVTVKRPGPCSTGVAVWLAHDDLLCWPVLVEDIDDLPVGVAQCDDADRVPRSGRTRSIWFPCTGIDNADCPFALEASRRPGQQLDGMLRAAADRCFPSSLVCLLADGNPAAADLALTDSFFFGVAGPVIRHVLNTTPIELGSASEY